MTKCLYIGIKNIIGGSELINDKIKGRSANHLCALSRPQELTPIKPIANFERTLSKPKFFKSRPKADTGPQLLGVCFGVGLFLVGIIYIYTFVNIIGKEHFSGTEVPNAYTRIHLPCHSVVNWTVTYIKKKKCRLL